MDVFGIIIISLALIHISDSFRILLIPIHDGSRMFHVANLGRQLVENGNEVHVLLMENPKSEEKFRKTGVKILEYKTRRPSGEANKVWIDQVTDEFVTEAMKGPFETFYAFQKLLREMVEEGIDLLQNEELMFKISNMNYDMAVIDGMPVFMYHYVIPYKYDIPFVTLLTQWDPFTTGVPNMASFVPGPIMPFSDQMTFIQRFTNCVVEWSIVFMKLIFKTPGSELVDMFVPEKEKKTLIQIQSSSQLFIQMTAPPVEYPRPSLPHVVSLPSLTIRKPVPIKETTLASFVNESPKGFILFSLGTISTKRLPQHILNSFIKVFKSVPQRTVWNYDSTNIKDVPQNIKFMKWLPQNDLLGHPKVRLFITHCGNAGQHEALYHGVPMLGIPIHSDQAHNAVRLIRYKYGLVINIENATNSSISNQLSELLNNPVYKANAQKASAIMKDDVMLPVQRAAYWIEHVTRFGSDHLRSPGLKLSWYQFWMLDTLSLLFIIFVVIIYLWMKITLKIIKTFRKLVYKIKKD